MNRYECIFKSNLKKRPKIIPVIVKAAVFSAVVSTKVFFSEVAITIVIFCTVVETVVVFLELDDEAAMSPVDDAAVEVFSAVVGMKVISSAVVATAVVVFSAVVGTALLSVSVKMRHTLILYLEVGS